MQTQVAFVNSGSILDRCRLRLLGGFTSEEKVIGVEQSRDGSATFKRTKFRIIIYADGGAKLLHREGRGRVWKVQG